MPATPARDNRSEPPSQLGDRILADAIRENVILASEIEARVRSTEANTAGMLYAIVYKTAHKTLGSWHQLAVHLNRRPVVADKLGLHAVPSRSTWERLHRSAEDGNIAGYLEQEARSIRRDLHLLGSGDVTSSVAKVADEDTAPEPTRVTMPQKRRAIEHLRPMMFAGLDFDRAANTSYPAERLLNLQAKISRETGYYCREWDERLGDDEAEPAPSPKAYFRSTGQRDVDGDGSWRQQFGEVYDRQIEAAKGAGLFDRPVDVYIDGTTIPYYQRDAAHPEGVIGGQPERGTNYGWHHITLSAHSGGRSIKVANYELRDRNSLYDAVTYLVDRAREHFSIRGLFMDAEFRAAKTLAWLDTERIDFMVNIPKKGDRLKTALARMEHDVAATDYRVTSSDRDTTLNLRLIGEPDWDRIDGDPPWRRGHGESRQAGLEQFGGGRDLDDLTHEELDTDRWRARRAFLTNMDGDAEAVRNRYQGRWRIETAYRVIKDEFLAKTKTRDFASRVFFWRFAVMLYNAWVLLDVFLERDYPSLVPDDRPVMAAATFAKEFFADAPPTD